MNPAETLVRSHNPEYLVPPFGFANRRVEAAPHHGPVLRVHGHQQDRRPREHLRGIAAKQLPYIFERFYSWPPNTGAGIGLALCKDIVHAWHGKIHCRSHEGIYTVFALEFPPARRAADLPAAPPSPRALDDRGFP